VNYIGIQQQIRSNNLKTILLLFLFPLLLILVVFLISNSILYSLIGLGFCLIWFLLAFNSHSSMIQNATSATPLLRKDNQRVYNMVENLCISQGMEMPKINIIYDDSLNAFASGINNKTFTITLSRGIINKLNDDELEGVIAHELTHIINRDVRLLIISIIFVGIFGFISESVTRGPNRMKSNDNGKNELHFLVISIIASIIAFVFSKLLQFAISRKREFMADAGAAEMTKNPHALASALRKISEDPFIEAVNRKDVAQLFIDNPKLNSDKKEFLSNLFSTHPPIEKRIEILEQFS
jgi:heat shock protein HtpX